jgi:RND family efflux transporter MFP subunit
VRRAVVGALVVAALAAGGGGWWRQQTPSTQTAASAVKAPAPAPAEQPIEFAAGDIATVAAVTIHRSVPLTGTLKPVEQTVVKMKVPGELREVVAREGMAVRRGQAVARVEALEYDVRVRERDAQLKAAASQVDQAKRTLDNTRQLKERNFVSQSALDQAQSAWEVAVGNRDAAAAQLALARKALADTVLVSPIDGIVAERFAQPGEKLPVDGRVMSIVDLSRMEIEAPVPAAEIGAVRVGQPVELRIEGVARPQLGRIVRIAPSTQAGTRSVPVYIALDNRDPSVRAGLFAQGDLKVQTREGVLAVPQSAIRDAGGRTFVYAIVDGRLVERDVKLGLRDASPGGARVEVLEGLAAGERIVASNLGALRIGAPVRIQPGAGPGNASTGATASAAPPPAVR